MRVIGNAQHLAQVVLRLDALELCGADHMLPSTLALHLMGVGMAELEVPLHIVFVTFPTMTHSGHIWPIVTEDVQGRCM
jgi:hypothetical protein